MTNNNPMANEELAKIAAGACKGLLRFLQDSDYSNHIPEKYREDLMNKLNNGDFFGTKEILRTIYEESDDKEKLIIAEMLYVLVSDN